FVSSVALSLFHIAALSLRSLFFFFFYCSGDHRDLHSFPTRRSSDLKCQGIFSAKWRPIREAGQQCDRAASLAFGQRVWHRSSIRSEEHTSELQSRSDLVCRLLLEKKKTEKNRNSDCMLEHWMVRHTF